MENYEYNNLVINKEFDKLTNINNIDDLVNYKYLNKYLIEYLLEQGIHTRIMDSKVNNSMYYARWIMFYLKYDILKPLLSCSLSRLLETHDGRIILDRLVEKLNNDERMELYHNLKKDSYWEFHNYERLIIEIYSRYGVSIPQIFISMPTILDSTVTKQKRYQKLLDEFKEAFSDTNDYILSFYLHEFKKRLSIDHKRTELDIRKLIDYKKKNRNFMLMISTDTEGEYDSDKYSLTISPHRQEVLTHELSHLMYDRLDHNEGKYLTKYNKIRKALDNPEVISKITKYLKKFHDNFEYMKKIFEEIYYKKINQKYGSYNAYIKVVYNDIYETKPEMISYDDKVYFYIDDEGIVDVVAELLKSEKEEFININTRNYYREELMLENLLDALLKGKIWEGQLNITSLSGHSTHDFDKYDDLSFDECLADYDTIRNSIKCERLIHDLESLVGGELIELLDDYLLNNRGYKHQK